MSILAICYLTRSLKLKPFGHNRRLRAMEWTNIATTKLFSENYMQSFMSLFSHRYVNKISNHTRPRMAKIRKSFLMAN